MIGGEEDFNDQMIRSFYFACVAIFLDLMENSILRTPSDHLFCVKTFR